MNKMNKSDIYCIKCLTVIDNSTNIQLNKGKVQINSFILTVLIEKKLDY